MRPHLVLLLSFIVCACSGASEEQRRQSAHTPAKLVRVAPVKQSEEGRIFALTGITRAANRATLAFQVSGNLAQRPVKIGDTVDKGQLIGQLSNPETGPQEDAARARVNELETRYEQARRDLDRVKKLFAQEAATRQELETAQSSHDALRASLANARAQLNRSSRQLAETRLEAPVRGTVDRVFFERGEFVPAGQPVVTLSGDGLVEVEIGVPENLLYAVKLGEPATLRLPLFEDREISGRVSEYASAAAGAGQLFPVIITLDDNQDLRAGLSVEWLLDTPQPQHILVPVAAVSSPGGSGAPRVYRVDNGQAVAVPVSLGSIIDDHVVVEGQLEPGQSVIVAGLGSLIDGRAVEVLP